MHCYDSSSGAFSVAWWWGMVCWHWLAIFMLKLLCWQALYSAAPESALQAQSMHTLRDLAHISHRYACMEQFR